ncbi:hypothetical protein KO566_07385 [Flavobacteriaceae bacterium XHP0103]|uniref:hypothetical protein n=1 Tax=Marixanthotalea marina TaxID=2844359 RepID=UPI002989E082|nr:hypothetical protein [Marixanthotalea marina]MBU3821880.1 hypothetical protein [Marixanthotalea marina]
MKAKFLSIITTCFIVTNVFSQASLNDYKYIIVPQKYEFLKEADQYQVNSLTEFLFNKYGFQAFMEGEEYPDDLNENRCLALTSDVTKDSALFKTKLQIILKNCNGLVVYTTKIGETREKDYARAYNEALRNAFEELETIDYKYVPSNKTSVAASAKAEPKPEVAQEIQQLREEIESLKQEKEEVASVPTEQKSVNTQAVVPVAAASSSELSKEVKDVLYAQQIENGFQLVDSSPKVVYKIRNTSLENVFMVEDKNATLYKKGDNWVLEYYENDVLKQEALNIKF